MKEVFHLPSFLLPALGHPHFHVNLLSAPLKIIDRNMMVGFQACILPVSALLLAVVAALHPPSASHSSRPRRLLPLARCRAAALVPGRGASTLAQQGGVGLDATSPLAPTHHSVATAAAGPTSGFHTLRRRNATPVGAGDLLPPDDPALWGDAQAEIGQGSLSPAREAAARGFRDGMRGGGYTLSRQREIYAAAYGDGLRGRRKARNLVQRPPYKRANSLSLSVLKAAAVAKKAVEDGFRAGAESASWLQEATPDDVEQRGRLAHLHHLGRLNGEKVSRCILRHINNVSNCFFSSLCHHLQILP